MHRCAPVRRAPRVPVPGGRRDPVSGVRDVTMNIDVGTVLRGTVCDLYSNLVTRPTGAAVRNAIEQQVLEVRVPISLHRLQSFGMRIKKASTSPPEPENEADYATFHL